MNIFHLCFFSLLLYQSEILLSSTVEKQIFVNYQNGPNCSLNPCDGSSDSPFETLALAISFIQSMDLEADNITLFLVGVNYMQEQDFAGKITLDSNGNYNMYFPSKIVVISSNLSISLIIESVNFYFSFNNEMIFENIDFRFNLNSFNNKGNPLIIMNDGNILTISNCSFDFLNSTTMKFSSLVSTNNSMVTTKNISITISQCSFTGSLFAYGILNLNHSTQTNITIEQNLIRNFSELSSAEIYLFNIFGSNNKITIVSTSFLSSSNLISIMSPQMNDLNFIIIQKSIFSSCNSIGSNGFIFLNNSNLAMNSCFFSNFFSYGDNAGIISANQSWFSNISNNIFINCSGNSKGGILYANSIKKVNIIQNYVYNNTFGSASLFFFGSYCDVNVGQLFVNYTNSYSLDNLDGGNIIALNFNNLTISNSQIYYSLSMGTGTVLYCANSSIINLVNLTIFHSYTNQSGIIYAVYNNTIMAQNIRMHNIYGNYSLGFVLENENAINISDSFFISFTGLVEHGGVLSGLNSNIILMQNCVMYNVTSFSGSGLFLLYFNQAVLYNITCEYHINQNIEYYGGIILIWHKNNVTISNSTFASSHAPNGGAVLSSEQYNNIVIEFCLFYNLSVHDPINQHGQGGIIFLGSYNTLIVKNSKFLDSTGDYGGAIFSSSYDFVTVSVSIFANLLTRNQSTAVGGWLNITSLVTDSIFVNNTCTFSGGVFYIDTQSVMNLTNALCIDSLAWGTGGVFYVNLQSQASVMNSTFISSNSLSSGGFIIILNNNNVILNNLSIIGFQSQEFGSLVYMIQNNSLQISNCKALNANISLDGGVLYIFQSNILIINNLLITNVSSQNTAIIGGAIYANSNNFIQITNSFFSNIGVVNSGGAVYLNSLNNLICINSTFTSITVDFGGTLFYLSDSNNVSMIKIIGNSFLSDSFGAIYMSQYNYAYINDSIIGNSLVSTYDGGLFFLKFVNFLEIYNSSFFSAKIQGYGGFMSMDSFNTLIIERSYILNTTASSIGDFIYSFQNNTILMDQIIIKNDEQMEKEISNLFYLDGQHKFNLSNVKILSQTCAGDGCLLFLNQENQVSIENLTITNLFSLSSFSVIAVYYSNILSLKQVEANFGSQFNVQYMILLDSNVITSKSVIIVLSSIIDKIYQSSGNNTFILFGDRLSSLNAVNYYFYSDQSNEVVQVTNMNFDIQINVIYASGSIITIKNCYFMLNTSNTSLLQVFGGSTLKITKSSFINKFNQKSQIFQASNSTIILLDNFAFNLQKNTYGSIFDVNQGNKILIKRNNFIRSLSLDYLFGVDILYNNASLSRFWVFQNFFQIIIGGSISFSSLSNESSILISKNKFKFNKAEQGGALLLQSFALNISNNTFYKCRAEIMNRSVDQSVITKGGAISFLNPGSENLFVNLTNNIFDSNEAMVGSPIYFDLLNMIIIQSENTFSNNIAFIFGTPFASKASEIDIHPDSDQVENTFDIQDMQNVVSGMEYTDCLFNLYLNDAFGNLILNSTDSLTANVSLVSSFPDNLDNEYSYKVINGHFCFNGPFTRNQQPIAASFYYRIAYGFTSSFDVFLKFRDCILGEILTDLNECKSCAAGTYSFTTNFSTPFLCQPCSNSDPFICNGGDFLSPQNGYWRLDKYSSNFIICPKLGACVQDLSNSTETIYTGACSNGYTGPLCAYCDHGFGKIDKTTCVSCDWQSWSFFFILNLKIVFKSFFLISLIFIGFKMAAKLSIGKPSKKTIMGLGLLKILLFHFQVLSFFPQIPIELSDSLYNGLHVTFDFLPELSDVFYFNCYSDIANKISVAYLILILCPIYILLIFIISLIVIISSNVYKQLNEDMPNLKLFHLIKILYFIIIVFSFVDVSQVYLEMFQCVNIGDDNRIMMRLYNDVTVDCNGLSHKIWIYAVTLPIFVILLQAIFSLFIQILLGIRKKDSLEKIKVKYLFGYFFYPYRSDLFFWDFINLVRRELILFIFLYFYEQMIQKNIYPLLLIYFVLICYSGLMLKFNPYSEKYADLNLVEGFSAIILAFNFLIVNFYCSYYFFYDTNQAQMVAFTMISLIILNLMFFIMWIYFFYSSYLKSTIMKIISKKVRKTLIADYSLKIKDYLKEKNYFYEKSSNIEIQKENKLGIYFNAFKELFQMNQVSTKTCSMKNVNEINSLITKRIPEKLYHRLKFVEYLELLQDKRVRIMFDSEFDSKPLEMTMEYNILGYNYFEYIFLYTISLKIQKTNFEIGTYGIYVDQEYLSITYESDVKFQYQRSCTNIFLNLIVKMYDLHNQKLFFYLIEKKKKEIFVFQIPLSINLFLIHIPLASISRYFNQLLNYRMLTCLSSETISYYQSYEKSLSTLKLFFPTGKQSTFKKSEEKFIGMISALPQKNLFLFYVINFFLSEKKFLIEFHLFETSCTEMELNRMIDAIIKCLQKAFKDN